MDNTYKQGLNQVCETLYEGVDNPVSLLLTILNKRFYRYKDTSYWEDIEQIGAIALWHTFSLISQQKDIPNPNNYIKVHITHEIQNEIKSFIFTVNIHKKPKSQIMFI